MRMKTTMTTLLILVWALGAGLAARAAVVTGTWTLAIEAPPPHGSVTGSLVLKQDGRKVTGTFSSDHTGNAKMEGEFADGQLILTMTVAGADASQATTLTAKFKDDDTLVGYVSGPMGDMTLTAKRAKDGR